MDLLFAHLGRIVNKQVDHEVTRAGLEKDRHLDTARSCAKADASGQMKKEVPQE
jgi:hypothetical protein